MFEKCKRSLSRSRGSVCCEVEEEERSRGEVEAEDTYYFTSGGECALEASSISIGIYVFPGPTKTLQRPREVTGTHRPACGCLDCRSAPLFE
jgi:hypothetical protein